MSKRIDTKELMANAFIDLLHIYSFDEITITQLTQVADVSRKTFYINFNTKEEVLAYYIEILVKQFVSSIECIDKIQIDKFVFTFFDFWQPHQSFLEVMKRNEMFFKLTNYFEFHLRKFMIEFNLPQLQTEESLIYSSSYHAAGICKILELWTENNFLENSEQITGYFFDAQGSSSTYPSI